MKAFPSLLLFCAIALSLVPTSSMAAESFWSTLGVRGGMSADDKDSNLRQFELFARYQLPWELRSRSGWGIGTQVEVTAGLMNASGDNGLIGTIGPSITLGNPGFPLFVDLGISAAGLTRDTFGNRDYNGYGQFISHGGLNYRFSDKLGVGYRYQHMSNAGMNGSSNPGLNLHMIGLSWFFVP